MKNVWLKYVLWLYVVFPAIGLLLIVVFTKLDFEDSSLEVILKIVVFTSWGAGTYFKVMSIRCPKCNKALHPSIKEIFTKFGWGFRRAKFVQKKCRKCGYDLRGRDSEKIGL